MKLVEMELSGFRAYQDPCVIKFDDLTVLAGKNDAGKSSIFEALALFLDGGKPDPSDFSVGGDGSISITCTFENLPPNVILDSSTRTTLRDERLLTQDGFLKIKKLYSGTKAASVFAIACHPIIEGQTTLLSLKQAQLKKLCQDLGIEEPAGDKRSNSTYRQAIWKSLDAQDANPELLTDVPLSSEDGKQISSALESSYPFFHLFKADRDGSEADNLAQDPAKVIAKTVIERHSEALAKLTAEISEEVVQLLGDVVDKLSDIAPELASNLTPQDIEPAWAKAFSALKFVDENQVPLSKRGSGTRRLVLLSFFRAEAEREIQDDGEWHRGVLIAVEEPETALHPDLQRETVNSLVQVSVLADRQVMLTTHSPNLIRHLPISSVRFVSSDEPRRKWSSASSEGDRQLLQSLDRTMGIFTDHNVRCFVIVEGTNDINGLRNISENLYANKVTGIPNLKSLEDQGLICFIPIGGCGAAALWESRLSPFHRPEVHILDSDKTSEHASISETTKSYQQRYAAKGEADIDLCVLDRRELENYLTPDAISTTFESDYPGFREKFESEIVNADWRYLDIPQIVAMCAHETHSPEPWGTIEVEKQEKKESAAKRKLASCYSHDSLANEFAENESDLVRVLRQIDSFVTRTGFTVS